MQRRVAALVAVVVSLSPWVHATEFSNTHVDLGYNDTLVGMAPPPGLYVRDDVNIITSGRLNNQAGHQTSLNLSALGVGVVPLRFRNTVEADTLSVAYVPDWKLPLLNATIGIAAYETVGNSRAGLTSAIGLPEARATTTAGLGDITVVPVFFAVTLFTEDLHAIFAPFDFTAPTGRYIKNSPIGNMFGLNYFSYRPALELTYLNKTGEELSLNLNASFNAQNQATGYKSGDEFSFTYAFEQFLTTKLAVGIGGYYYQQVGDDRVHGQVVNANPLEDLIDTGPGNRGETFALGPILSYMVTPSARLQAHWDHELQSYNRPQRDQVYARATLRF